MIQGSFEKKESDALGLSLGVTIVLQTRVHPSQQTTLRSFRYALPSTITSFFQIHSSRFGAPAVVREELPPVIKFIQCFSFIPVWSTSRGMGGVPPSHNTVILLCAVSFLLNHDPDLCIFSLRTSGPTTAGFPAFAMTSTLQPSNVWRRQATRCSSFT